MFWKYGVEIIVGKGAYWYESASLEIVVGVTYLCFVW